MKRFKITILALLFAVGTSQAMAAEGVEIPKRDWTFDGIFGSFERPQLKRGYQVFREVCNGCHSLDLIAYRNLQEIGFTEDEVKEIAAEYDHFAGPDDEGEILVDGELRMRPGLPTDRYYAPFPNSKAAAASNGGAVPPDLSLMAKARIGGPNYIYALMTGYEDEAPEDSPIPEDKYYNHFFPGHAISMGPPLFEEAVEYEDGTPATLEQLSEDVSVFLMWAAEPQLETRKSMGIKVLLFLIVLTALLYALKRQIWSDVH
ncbi:MAG: cytochrome c1 [Magnetospiraceae bacterium]